jgi:flagellar protein FliO/FliZ
VAGQDAAGPIVNENELALDNAATPTTETAIAAPSSLGAIVRTLIALILVAAAIYGVVFLLKKIARPPSTKDQFLKVLSSAHLGSNRFVHVVALGGKAWLVGASDGGVRLISELEDQETVDAMLLEDSRRQANTALPRALDFKALMRRFGTGGELPPNVSLDSIRRKRERLNKL